MPFFNVECPFEGLFIRFIKFLELIDCFFVELILLMLLNLCCLFVLFFTENCYSLLELVVALAFLVLQHELLDELVHLLAAAHSRDKSVDVLHSLLNFVFR